MLSEMQLTRHMQHFPSQQVGTYENCNTAGHRGAEEGV